MKVDISGKQRITSAGLKWSAYDFGNSAYALNIITLFFPLYFTSYISRNPAQWSKSVAISILLSALLAPVIGHIADRKDARRSALILSASLAIMGTVAIGLTTSPILSKWLFVFSNIAFYLSTSFYDAMLVTMSRGSRTETSGFGWAMGYLGGLICLVLCWTLLGFKMPTTQDEYLKIFLLTGLFYMVSSLVFFRSLSPDSDANAASLAVRTEDLSAIRQFQRTPLLLVLLGSFVIMEGVTTIVYFTAIYASETLHFSVAGIAGLLALTQIIAMPATYAACRFAERRNNEFSVLIMANTIWIAVSVAMFLLRSPVSYIVIACFTGLVIGTTPALLRACISKITPAERRGSVFGFSLLCSRAASIIGPLTFGVVASRYGAPMGMLTVIPFFVVGSIVLHLASARIICDSNHVS